MSEVKWIKITTDIFDDEKILLIESMPDAYAIIVVWFKLLCLAGKQNNSGVFTMGTMPYTDQMLATIFRMKESTVQMALRVFEHFGMVEIVDGVVTIPNWGKHQQLESLERSRELTRKRVAEYRKRQKSLTAGNETITVTTCNATVTQTDKEEDKEKEEDKDIESISCKSSPKKIKFAECVSMTQDEHDKLVEQYGSDDAKRLIEILDNYKAASGKKYKSDYRAILNWCVSRLEEENRKKYGRNHHQMDMKPIEAPSAAENFERMKSYLKRVQEQDRSDEHD